MGVPCFTHVLNYSLLPPAFAKHKAVVQLPGVYQGVMHPNIWVFTMVTTFMHGLIPMTNQFSEMVFHNRYPFITCQ